MRGLGTDIIEIDRVRKVYHRFGKRFLMRTFTELEQKYCSNFHDPSVRLAARFAAKEAIAKALGTGFREGLSFLDIEVLNDSLGRPYVNLSHTLEKKLGLYHLVVSLSHCKEYATATALIF